MMPIHTQILSNFSHRLFSTCSQLYYPGSDDQDKLFQKIQELEKDYNETDRDIEELTEVLKESEVEFQEDDDETELSKYAQERVDEKDDLIGDCELKRDQFLGEGDEAKEKAATLELLEKAIDFDIETLNQITAELSPYDSTYSAAGDLLVRLEDQKARTEELKEECHESGLASTESSEAGPSNQESSETAPSNQESSEAAPYNQESFRQDSYDVQQTDYSSFDPFDE